MPGGSQHEAGAGMARFIDEEVAVEAAVLPAPRRLPQMRCARGGLSLGRIVGASDHGALQCRRGAGARVELAGNGAPLWPELEERSDDCEARGRLWSASSRRPPVHVIGMDEVSRRK